MTSVDRNRVLRSAQLGVKVTRGPDWNWGDQDAGKTGTTIGYGPDDGWVKVQWQSGAGCHRTGDYRVGAEGKFDLRIVTEDVPEMG